MARNRSADAPPPVDQTHDMIPAPPVTIISRESGSRLIPPKTTALKDCPSNIDQSTRQGRAIAFNAVSSAELDLGANGELQLQVHHWLVHWRESVDEESGELKSYPALVIITPQGDCAAFTSEVVLHRWADLIESEGPGPWDPPLEMIVRARTSRRSKRTWHELLMVV